MHRNDPNNESFDPHCSPTQCDHRALDFDAKRCTQCDQMKCVDCLLGIRLGGEIYCKTCATCRYPGLHHNEVCGALAIDVCQDCEMILCDVHLAKHPEHSLCPDCFADRAEATCPDCHFYPCRCNEGGEPDDSGENGGRLGITMGYARSI